MLFLFLHLLACMIYTTVDSSRIWVAPLDYGYLQTDVWYKDRSSSFVYLKMLYHSALVFALVDITPRSPTELVVTSCLMVTTAIITAYIYGQFAQYNFELKANYTMFMDEFDTGNSVMVRLKCKSELIEKVRDFQKNTWTMKTQQIEIKTFQTSLSHLRRERVR